MSAEITAAADPGLAEQMSRAILCWIRDEGVAPGARLTERELAARFKVSRSPIRAALRLLYDAGYIERTDTGRYLISATARDGAPFQRDGEPGDDTLYLRIAEDHLDGRLTERVTESGLTRRYGLSRTHIADVMRRIANEGWAAPLPGHGWEFLPVLTSIQAYQDSYRYRLLVEPAAILEPTFEPDRLELLRRRDEQQELVDGRIHSVSPAQLFDLNTRCHGTIARCSRNGFIIDSLERINRLRRLIEYRQALVPDRAVVRCREHVALIDLLLAGKRVEASEALREHLSTVSVEKSTDSSH